MPDWQAWFSRGGQMPPLQKSRRLSPAMWVRSFILNGGNLARHSEKTANSYVIEIAI
jgi:hypothetical protein